MSESGTITTKRVKGEILAKIIWIIGALIYGVYMIITFSAITSPDESVSDCLTRGIRLLLLFAAFVVGLLYLFLRKQAKLSLICAIIYLVANAYNLVLQFSGEGRLSAGTIVTLILSLIVYVIFALFTGMPSKFLKLWFLPALLLFLVGLLGAFWTELADPKGFVWDGFILDVFTSLITAVPIFVMSLVVRNRTKQ